jgi:dephospho-CoA kinase
MEAGVARFENKYVIGLTGNIAVGKSVVRRMLQHLGAYTIDADGLTHQAMMPGAPAYKPVIDTFGRYIVDPNGQVNRAKLGSLAFAVPEVLATLEGIVHPVVGNAIVQLINRASQRVIIVEAIKLLEGNLASLCDAIWVVDAPREAQIARLVKDRAMSEAEAKKRIEAQNPQAEKLVRANVVINNSSDVDLTWKQVQDAWNRIPKERPTPPPTEFLKPTPNEAPVAPFPSIKPLTPAPVAPAPVAVAPAAPAAVAVPAKRSEIVVKTDTQEAVVINGVRVKRGTPNHAEQIASFMAEMSGRNVSRMDVILGFGQKSYYLALDEESEISVLAGWQVENLIATIDELYVASDAPLPSAIVSLVTEIENAARTLQSEVCFVYLPTSGDPAVRSGFVRAGYTMLVVDELTSPAWREAASEQLRDGRVGLMKALRLDRVTKPI